MRGSATRVSIFRSLPILRIAFSVSDRSARVGLEAAVGHRLHHRGSGERGPAREAREHPSTRRYPDPVQHELGGRGDADECHQVWVIYLGMTTHKLHHRGRRKRPFRRIDRSPGGSMRQGRTGSPVEAARVPGRTIPCPGPARRHAFSLRPAARAATRPFHDPEPGIYFLPTRAANHDIPLRERVL